MAGKLRASIQLVFCNLSHKISQNIKDITIKDICINKMLHKSIRICWCFTEMSFGHEVHEHFLINTLNMYVQSPTSAFLIKRNIKKESLIWDFFKTLSLKLFSVFKYVCLLNRFFLWCFNASNLNVTRGDLLGKKQTEVSHAGPKLYQRKYLWTVRPHWRVQGSRWSSFQNNSRFSQNKPYDPILACCVYK